MRKKPKGKFPLDGDGRLAAFCPGCRFEVRLTPKEIDAQSAACCKCAERGVWVAFRPVVVLSKRPYRGRNEPE